MEGVSMSAVATVGVIVLCIMRIYFMKGPLNWPLAGMVPWILWHIGNIYEEGCKLVLEKGGTFIVRGPWFLRSNLFEVVTHTPDNVQYILKENFSNFPKGPYFKEVFFHTFGHGIFTSDDELWKRQRKPTVMAVSSSIFKDRNLKMLQKSLQEKLLPLIEELKEKKASVDLQQLLVEFTMDNFFMAIFGREAENGTFTSAFDEATECCIYRFVCPSFAWKFMRFFNIGFEKSLKEAEAIVKGSVTEMVKARVKELENDKELQGDILSNFIKLERDQGRTPSQEVLEGLAMSMFLAGKDTTGLAMSWFFWFICMHPHVEEKIVSELSQILKSKHLSDGYDTSKVFGWEELRSMNYLQAALSETMRLRPPVPAVFREAIIDTVLPDGTHIKKGTKCLVFIYATNRMESTWGKDALEFKPERWIGKGGVYMNQSEYKYPVFVAGPRICVGKDLAYANMKCIVANILARYRVKLEAGHQVKPKLGITLFMKHGLKVTLHARNDILP
ncbi:hypothetical protein SUGI_0021690 [Cryptomeria japonica]|uniref:cytochrome P450 86B1 n=1 Tax=Cryptomeria japonica TaxID=3369 RepID=UPI0024089B6B|nr:cytochrome P450 86B1 [Cryptomeria japonica]GLJ05626.1 hypothetical protein SUGI_0021690 [Cryptomeria japonica]